MFISRKRLSISLLLLLLVASCGAIFLSLRLSKMPLPSKEKPAGTLGEAATPRRAPVVLPKDRSLRSYSSQELQALVEQLAQNKRDENREFTTSEAEYLVGSGETIATDGYETEPGVFVFSTMTLLVTGSASEPKVAIKLNRAKLTVSGEYSALVDDEAEIHSGRGYGATNDRYSLYLRATVLPGGEQIKVRMKESEYEKSRRR